MSTYKNTSKDRKLLDEVRDVMRLHHYSIHTERTYCDWIKRYIRYHSMTNRQDLIDGEAKIKKPGSGLHSSLSRRFCQE